MASRARPKTILGVDIGGTGIKAALVDVVHGQLLTQRVRAKTPTPAKPEPMIEAIRTLVGQIQETRDEVSANASELAGV